MTRAGARVAASFYFSLVSACALPGCSSPTALEIDAASSVDAPADALDRDAADAERGNDAGPCDELRADADGDGARSVACGGNDCDDGDPTRAPSMLEVCDPAGHDEDCDPGTYGTRDADHDGYVDAACCNGSQCGDDCDDGAPARHPGGSESCDGGDQDCDGTVDEGVLLTIYRDADGDTFGDMSMPMAACGLPGVGGWAFDAGDCDDRRTAIHPGASEACDGALDDDCDAAVDEGCSCTTGMTQACGTRDPSDPTHILEEGECRAGTQSCVGGMYGGCSGDVGPATEVCSPSGPALDEDCDGSVDEGTLVTCYPDPDADGYPTAGAVGSTQCGCSTTETSTPPSAGADCSPSDGTIHPGAAELCDGVDSNCDGYREDADDDGHSAVGAPCTGGALPPDDCNDAQPRVHPGQTCFHEDPVCLRNGDDPCYSMIARRRVCGRRQADGNCDVTMPPCSTAGCFTWDYDCSGTDEQMPSSAATFCRATPPIGWSCAEPAACYPDGATAYCTGSDGTLTAVTGAPVMMSGTCGSRISGWNECSFTCTGGPCLFATTVPQPTEHAQPCR